MTQSQNLNDNLLFFLLHSWQMVQVGLCTLLTTLNKWAISTVISKDNRRVAIEQIFMSILKNYFVSYRLFRLLSYWTTLLDFDIDKIV